MWWAPDNDNFPEYNCSQLICCCRIVSSLKSRMTLPSVLFTKVTYIWAAVAAAARDGSSLSMEPSAVVPCLLTQCSLSDIVRKTTTDPGWLRATVTTYARAKSELESTLGIVQGLETPMVTQAGIQCLVWLLKKFLGPSDKKRKLTWFLRKANSSDNKIK